jgi:hypothetical protein
MEPQKPVTEPKDGPVAGQNPPPSGDVGNPIPGSGPTRKWYTDKAFIIGLVIAVIIMVVLLRHAH